jgi:polyisoprenoid-binding protein YceI
MGGRGPMQMAPAPDPTKPAKLDIGAGTVARYKVREQLAGISFPSDAVGTTQAVTGTIVVNPDGTIDAAKSKITVDLTTIQSDQQMRDGYVRNNTLETQKYPTLEFVPKRAVGLPSLARLLSVDDKIELEIEFKCKRTTA